MNSGSIDFMYIFKNYAKLKIIEIIALYILNLICIIINI